MNELKWDVDHLGAACQELRASKRFHTLLAMILELVNEINTGGEGGASAVGFTLESLTKLSETKAFDNKTTVLKYLVKVIRKTDKDVLKFREDIKSVVLAKGVVMERLLASTKQLCEDSRVVTEAAKDDGDEYREFLKDPPTPKYKSRDMKAQRASVKELREMVTFLPVKDVPIGKMDTTHFERFALFSKLELQKALSVIKEANQNYISVLEYFGEDMKTQASEFFAMIDHFMEAFDQALDLVEKEEELKTKEARRELAKQAKLKVKSAFKVAVCAAALKEKGGGDLSSDIKKPYSRKDRPILNQQNSMRKLRDKEELAKSSRPMLMAATPARKQKRRGQSLLKDSLQSSAEDPPFPPSGGPMNIAAVAAAAARKKEQPSQSLKKESSLLSKSTMHVAAMAAAAVCDKEEQSQSSAKAISVLSGEPMNIAALAAAAARKKEEQRQPLAEAEESPPSSRLAVIPVTSIPRLAGGLMNIAALAAAAARKKEEKHIQEEARRLVEENADRERALAKQRQ